MFEEQRQLNEAEPGKHADVEESWVHQVKGGGEESGDDTSRLVNQEEGDRSVEDGGEPVNNQETRQLTADEQAKRREDPVRAEIRHRVLPLVEPLWRRLLESRDEIQNEKLEL